MKTILRFVLFFSCLMTFHSCSQIIDNIIRDKEEDNYTSPFQGKWSGSYGNNTFTMIVYKSGSVEIIRNYEFGTETLFGSVNNSGVLNAVYSPNIDFVMYGNLSTKNGTWKQNSLTGTWSVVKQ